MTRSHILKGDISDVFSLEGMTTLLRNVKKVGFCRVAAHIFGKK